MEEVQTLIDDNNVFNKGIVEIEGKKYERYTLKTHFINRGESYVDIVEKYVRPHYQVGDTICIAEKIISLCQNRVVDKSTIKPGFWAKTLSKFVMKTTAGYSVGNIYKMQLAINLAGLPRILFASFCSAVTKIFGIRGVFYIIAGNEINGIDGFYGEAFKEYAELGILNPENPDKVAEEIQQSTGITAFVVDANDIGVNILGKSKNSDISSDILKKVIKDNPAGQGKEQTPITLIREIH